MKPRAAFQPVLVLICTTFVASGQGIRTVAGPIGSTGDGGPALTASMEQPVDTATDSAGHLYIADAQAHRIRRVDAKTGIITTFAGTGIAGNSGDGGPAVDAQFSFPSGLAVDASDHIYISDFGNHSIRVVDAASGNVFLVAGTGESGLGDPGEPAQFNFPGDIDFDANGRLLIADTNNHRIALIDFDVGVSTFAGTPQVPGFSGDGGAAVLARLNRPIGLAVDRLGGTVFVSDQDNQRIREISFGVIATVAGTGDSAFAGDGGPARAASLSNPRGLHADVDGNLFIADQNNNRVRRVDAITGVIETVAGSSRSGFSGDGGLATEAAFSQVVSVSTNLEGDLFIADLNGRIRVVDAQTGIVSTLVGDAGARVTCAATLDATALRKPGDVAFDKLGNVYWSDQQLHIVRRLDVNTGVISTVAGTGESGFGGDGGPATEARLSRPHGLDLDEDGNLYVADGFNHRVRKIDGFSGTIDTIAGNGDFAVGGDGVPAISSPLGFPFDVVVDSAGELLLSEAAGQRIRRIDGAGIITTVAGRAAIAGYSGDGALAANALLNGPTGLALDRRGNLFFADSLNDVVRRIDSSSGIIITVAGNGTAGYSGDGGPGILAALHAPFGVAIDAQGDLYIAEELNHTIRKLDALTGVITTFAGFGVAGFFDNPLDARFGLLARPLGVGVDPFGNVYIADSANARIRRVDSGLVPLTVVAGNADAELGRAVAVAGNLIAVGLPNDRSRGDGNTGAVAVYRMDGCNQSFEGILDLPAGAAFTRFGRALDLDGDTLVVGAAEPPAGAKGTPLHAAIYQRLAEGWTFKTPLAGDASGDDFGASVAVDGDRVIVGAPMDSSAGSAASGAVYVFGFDGANATMEGKISPPGVMAGSQFGTSVAAHSGHFAVGVPGPVQGALDGSVQLYDQISNNLMASAAAPSGGFSFGAAVDVEGNMVAVGAPTTAGGGAVFTFDLTGSSLASSGDLVAPEGRAGDEFGRAVSIEENDLFVGAPGVTPGSGGTGAVFRYTDMTLAEEIEAGPDEQGFGFAVDASGERLIIGAPLSDATLSGASVRQSAVTVFRSGFER